MYTSNIKHEEMGTYCSLRWHGCCCQTGWIEFFRNLIDPQTSHKQICFNVHTIMERNTFQVRSCWSKKLLEQHGLAKFTGGLALTGQTLCRYRWDWLNFLWKYPELVTLSVGVARFGQNLCRSNLPLYYCWK